MCCVQFKLKEDGDAQEGPKQEDKAAPQQGKASDDQVRIPVFGMADETPRGVVGVEMVEVASNTKEEEKDTDPTMELNCKVTKMPVDDGNTEVDIKPCELDPPDGYKD